MSAVPIAAPKAVRVFVALASAAGLFLLIAIPAYVFGKYDDLVDANGLRHVFGWGRDTILGLDALLSISYFLHAVASVFSRPDR